MFRLDGVASIYSQPPRQSSPYHRILFLTRLHSSKYQRNISLFSVSIAIYLHDLCMIMCRIMCHTYCCRLLTADCRLQTADCSLPSRYTCILAHALFLPKDHTYLHKRIELTSHSNATSSTQGGFLHRSVSLVKEGPYTPSLAGHAIRS